MFRSPGIERNGRQFLGDQGLLPIATDDFFRARLDQMIDLRHPLAVLAMRMPWADIEAALAPTFVHRDRKGRAVEDTDMFSPTLAVASDGISNAGRPRLPIRLMVALLYLKHACNESDEALVERWAQDVYFQFFSGPVYFEPRLAGDPAQISRFRRVLGEAGLEQLIKTTIEAAVSIGAEKKTEFERVIVDTTVQSKAIAHPADTRLLQLAREKIARLAKLVGIQLKQTHEREGKTLRRKAGGYAHATQFKRLRGVLKRQRTILGRLLREVRREMAGLAEDTRMRLDTWVQRAERVHKQRLKDKNKLYAPRAPEAECIGKGKARQPYEFGVKVSLAVTRQQGLMVGARSFTGVPYDGQRGSALPRCGQGTGTGASHSPREVQVPHAQAEDLAEAAPGKALHAVWCAAGFNIRWLLRAIAGLGLPALLLALFGWALYAANTVRSLVEPPVRPILN